ncbi:MAG: hypothetical protein JNJ83_11825 [Verrucomicrobiaceae bacterium]|nr:hypothetical protein [Verrucomicrobiaceae bacterium]
MKPPETTLEDIQWLFIVCFVALTVVHLSRLALGFDTEAQKVAERAKKLLPLTVVELPVILRAARRVHLSGAAWIATFLPMIALVLGTTVCSFLRDRGHLIFPWLIPGAFALVGLVSWFSRDWRQRAILETALSMQSDPAADPEPLETCKTQQQ